MLISTHILCLRVLGIGHSLVDQWLGLCSSTAGGMDSFPGGDATSIEVEQKKKKKKESAWSRN